MLALLQEARLEALNRLLQILRESADQTQVRLAATAILRLKPDPEPEPDPKTDAAQKPEPEVQLVTPQMLTLRAHAALATQLAKLTSSLRKAKDEQFEHRHAPADNRATATTTTPATSATPTAASRLAAAAGLPAG